MKTTLVAALAALSMATLGRTEADADAVDG